MAHEVVNIFGAYIEYFLLYMFLWIFYDTHPKRKTWRISCHIIMPLAFVFFSNTITSTYGRPILYILCAWMISIGFQGQVWKRLFSVAVFQIILIFFEILVSTIFYPFMDFSQETVYLALNILVKIGSLIILAIIFLFSKRHDLFCSILSTRHTFLLLIFSFASFLLILTIDYLIMKLGKSELFIGACIIILLCIISNIGLYYLFYQLSIGETAKIQLNLINLHLAQQKEQQSYMEQANQEIRKLSHDLNHYLSVIYGYLQEGNTDAAITELKKRQLEIAKNQLFDTGYPILNSILSYKFQKAQEKNIQVQLFWSLNIPIQLSVTDLAVILSNGLDNAIEAAQYVTKATPFLSITVDSIGEYIRIIINNNTHSVPEIIDGKITTTKKEKQIHGFGLESIRTLAHRYNGDSFIEYQNGIFTLTVLLQNCPESSINESENETWKK